MQRDNLILLAPVSVLYQFVGLPPHTPYQFVLSTTATYYYSVLCTSTDGMKANRPEWPLGTFHKRSIPDMDLVERNDIPKSGLGMGGSCSHWKLKKKSGTNCHFSKWCPRTRLLPYGNPMA